MKEKDLICIGCPLGCSMKVEVEGNQVLHVEGNTCKRGEDYARKEITNPTRIVTSSVIVEGGSQAVVPVKTRQDIPKGKIRESMSALKGIKVTAPVRIGDVIVSNVAGTGIDIVATKHILVLTEAG